MLIIYKSRMRLRSVVFLIYISHEGTKYKEGEAGFESQDTLGHSISVGLSSKTLLYEIVVM